MVSSWVCWFGICGSLWSCLPGGNNPRAETAHFRTSGKAWIGLKHQQVFTLIVDSGQWLQISVEGRLEIGKRPLGWGHQVSPLWGERQRQPNVDPPARKLFFSICLPEAELGCFFISECKSEKSWVINKQQMPFLYPPPRWLTRRSLRRAGSDLYSPIHYYYSYAIEVFQVFQGTQKGQLPISSLPFQPVNF